jgi:hypothetical protein
VDRYGDREEEPVFLPRFRLLSPCVPSVEHFLADGWDLKTTRTTMNPNNIAKFGMIVNPQTLRREILDDWLAQ